MAVGALSNSNAIDYREVFSPGNEAAYQSWREWKLADYQLSDQKTVVNIGDFSSPSAQEISKILNQVYAHNFALYQIDPATDIETLRAQLIRFCRELGLNHTESNRSQDNDGIVSIQVEKSAIGAGYIPYSTKPLSWHSDGYYNAVLKRIRGMVLHCVRDAGEGGENRFLDHEIAYIRLRDANPSYIGALMHHEAMTIPENTDQRSPYRPPSTGPVFLLDKSTGRLQMRYSARVRNIIWRDDADTSAARAKLAKILSSEAMIVNCKMQPGQGIISNNILHNRTKFTDRTDESGSSRLLYRIRYLDAVRLPEQALKEKQA